MARRQAAPAPTHHELLHADGEGGGVEQDLPVLGQEADDVLDEHHKVLRQQLVRLTGTRGGGTTRERSVRLESRVEEL